MRGRLDAASFIVESLADEADREDGDDGDTVFRLRRARDRIWFVQGLEQCEGLEAAATLWATRRRARLAGRFGLLRAQQPWRRAV